MSWIDADVIARLEARYGRPREVAIAQDVGPETFAPFEASIGKGRRHDVTLFIRDARGRFAVIRKPSYPPDVFRPASGGVEPGEDFAAGARREAREETGLAVELERYLLRVRASFAIGARREAWTSHVFLARSEGGALAPEDTHEIAEARWASEDEMRRALPARLRASGSQWLAYRAALQEAAMAALDG
jgi:ADP-ribose pyrophosphatase YjhB (NUDIX family)